MAIARGWEWLDDSKLTEEQQEKNRSMIQEVVTRLNAMWNKQEQQQFQREFDLEEGRDYEAEMDEEDIPQFKAKQNLDQELEEKQEEALLEKLEELGARMMRPYEHHNEMEHYMAYMERDRD